MATTTKEPLTISIPEAAKMIGLGKNQTYRAVENGEIEAVEINGRKRVLLRPLKRKFGGTAA